MESWGGGAAPSETGTGIPDLCSPQAGMGTYRGTVQGHLTNGNVQRYLTDSPQAEMRTRRGTSLMRKRTPLGSYRRPMLRVLGGVLGGWAFSYGRGTPAMLSCEVGKIKSWPDFGLGLSRFQCVLQGLLEIKDTHRPRVLR